ncbi:MAG: alpha/beta-type small acid-soluble spore protein [Thermincola sp.]|nr:alpha/beta-type small acid-soluble spore protein [Thermincola sp.]MDT3701551.1 alpha/beta-type small acid-soluble spore protein [Thermincola sp.]
MGTGQKRNKLVVPQAAQAMYNFKYEMANEVGITNQIQGGYWGQISSRDCGAVGGHMVKKMIEAYEQSLAGRS